MIEDAATYLKWLDAPPTSERSEALFRARRDLGTWMEIIDQHPRSRRTVAMNRSVPLGVLEILRLSSDFGVQWAVRSRPDWQDAHPEDPKPFDFDPDELVHYELTPLERSVLSEGLLQWAGPAHPTEEMAVALGFSSEADLEAGGARIRKALDAEQPMTHSDWARSLLATEVVFMSDVVGAGKDWATVTGISDVDTFRTLRNLQEHLVVLRPHG